MLKICAPLWKNMTSLEDRNFVYPIGLCFNIDKNLDVATVTTKMFNTNKFTDIRSSNASFLTYEMAEIGFAISNKKVC